MSKALPNAGKPGKPNKSSGSINNRRARGEESRVRETLDAAKADGLIEVEINGKKISLNSKAEIEKVLKELKEKDK